MHQLKTQLQNQWEIQDQTSQATQAAQSAHLYHELTQDKARRIASEFAVIDDELDRIRREQRRQAGEIQDMRNNCLIWGAISAVVCSIAVAWIMQPSTPVSHQPYQPQYQQVLP